MKKVLLVTASLRTGGVEKLARDLGLSGKDRFSFHYLVFEEQPGEYEPALAEAGCRILRMKPPAENYGSHALGLIRLMKRERYDAVHAHTMFHCGWVMAAGKIAGVPVRIAHAHSELKEGGILRRIYEDVMRCWIRRFSTDRIACSEAAGRRLFGRADFRVIPNGIRTEAFAFDPAARQTLRRDLGWERCRIFGHVGRLNRVKNQMFLLELVSRAVAEDPAIRLLLLGEGEDRSLLEREIAARKLENCVKMPGNIPEPGPWYSAMDGFFLPSLYEGMPLALLEARCNGLPCLVSDRVGFSGPGIRHLPLEKPEAWEKALGETLERTPGILPDFRETAEKIFVLYERSGP